MPPSLQLVELLEEGHRVDDHAVAEHAVLARVEHAGRDLVKDELVVPYSNGVPGVGPALIARDPVGVLGQDIDDLALTLVAPLRPDDNEAPHTILEHD